MPPKIIVSICHVWLLLESVPGAAMCSVSLHTTRQDSQSSLTGGQPHLLVKDFLSLSSIRKQILRGIPIGPVLVRGTRADGVNQTGTAMGTMWLGRSRDCGVVSTNYLGMDCMYVGGQLES